MSGGDEQADGPQPGNPHPVEDLSMAQTNSADTGGTVNAVQHGNQTINNFLGPDAQRLFTQWERSLRRTPGTLSIAPGQVLAMERETPLASLTDALSTAPAGHVLLVRGEPGVGKTALVLRSIDELRTRSVHVLAAAAPAMSPYAGGLDELIHALGAQDGTSKASAPHGILVLDGAEAAQEGLESLVVEAVEAAMGAGLTAVLVSRDDAADTLRDLLDRAGCTDVGEVIVPSLDDREIAEILASAPELARLASDPRSRWLLRRIALIDLLLRSVRRGAALPAQLASEAEVYTHVWLAFVLNNQRMANGVVPEDRGAALVSLAEGRLTGRRAPSLPGPALASLRSDGILAPLGESSATSNEEHAFAHDVLRDYATTKRLLLDDGLSLLNLHGPRWAIRAGRIFCQIRLRSGADAAGGFVTRWNQVRQQFKQLAATHGSRWNEVPWEAVLSSGWCAEALAALTEDLVRRPELLSELLRCVTLRFGEDGDPLVAAPVVAWLAEHTDVFTDYRSEPCDTLVVTWLRSVSEQEILGDGVPDYRPVRVQLREAMFRSVPKFPTPAFIEALALLGADRDDAADTLLRRLARERAHTLMPAVDRGGSARCLATTNPALLTELAAAYYAPSADPLRLRGEVRGRSVGKHEYLGIRSQGQAAWWRGPFFSLLQTDPVRCMELISTLLAAAVRPEDRYKSGDEPDPDSASAPALRGDFLGTGDCEYPGRGDAWSWYRGALNGPQPCMSALMALDRWLDQLVQGRVMPVRRAAELVLRRVGTVAGAGLAYGILVRHLDEISDELDGFLASPLVWELENGRTVADMMFRRSNELPGEEHLKLSPAQVAMSLVIDAKRRGDNAAAARLQAVAGRLRSAATDVIDDLTLRFWADHLDCERFVLVRDGGQAAVEVQPSEAIRQELERRRGRSDLASKQYELLNRYALHQDLPGRIGPPALTEPSQLASDLQTARSLLDHADCSTQRLGGVYAVAAAAVCAAANGTLVAVEELCWSVDLLTEVVLDCPAHLDADVSDTIQPWEGSRQAALALPRSLLPTVALLATAPLGTERVGRIREAVLRCSAHPVHEVRAYAAEGLRPLWSAPCSATVRSCHHTVAWEAVEAGLRLVVEDANSLLASRAESLRPPAAALDQLTGEELSLPVLGTALPAILEAARLQHCRTAQARSVRAPVLDAYARAACVWGDGGYHRHSEEHGAVAEALLRSGAEEPTVMTGFVDTLTVSPAALSHLLHGLKIAATYSPELAKTLGVVWPHIMESVLTRPLPTEQVDRFGHQERLMEELVPNPTPSGADLHVDSTLARARRTWLTLGPLRDLIDSWTTSAGTERFAIDNLVGFLKAQPIHEQIEPGMRWVRQLCVSSNGAVDSAGFLLIEWLQDLRSEVTASARPHYRAVVDGLALAQHPSAPALQRLDE